MRSPSGASTLGNCTILSPPTSSHLQTLKLRSNICAGVLPISLSHIKMNYHYWTNIALPISCNKIVKECRDLDDAQFFAGTKPASSSKYKTVVVRLQALILHSISCDFSPIVSK